MSGSEELLALYEAKARAELDDANGAAGVDADARRGALMAPVALVVGLPGTAEPPLSGEAGEAVGKALVALGFPAGSEFVIASHPLSDAGDGPLARRLRLAIEAVDPTLVLALDAVAARDLSVAFDLGDLLVGVPVSALGRTFGYVGEFAASLGDESAKVRAWGAMKAIARADVAATSARRQSAPRDKSDVRSDRPKA